MQGKRLKERVLCVWSDHDRQKVQEILRNFLKRVHRDSGSLWETRFMAEVYKKLLPF